MGFLSKRGFLKFIGKRKPIIGFPISTCQLDIIGWLKSAYLKLWKSSHYHICITSALFLPSHIQRAIKPCHIILLSFLNSPPPPPTNFPSTLLCLIILFFFSSLCLWPLFLWEFLLPSWLDSISKTEIVVSFPVWNCLDGFQSPITVERAFGTEASYWFPASILLVPTRQSLLEQDKMILVTQMSLIYPASISLHVVECNSFLLSPHTSSFENPPDWEIFLSSHKEILSSVLQWPFALIIRGLITIHWIEWNFPDWNDGS